MEYKTADISALRQQTRRIMDYVWVGGSAVRVELEGGRVAWIMLERDLCNIRDEPMVDDGRFVVEAVPADPFRKERGKGEIDIVGAELKRIGFALYGAGWHDPLARDLGIPVAAVRSLARGTLKRIPRKVSGPLKKLATAAGINWRTI